MKIIHCCLSCFYIDGYSYQENELVRQNILDGHDVLVVASTESYGADRNLTYVSPGEYIGEEGARVIRLPYRKVAPRKVMAKLRMHSGLYEILCRENPDVILFHGLCGWELLTLKRYKSFKPNVRIYADSHEDFYNSGRGFLSKYLLHRIYYKSILKRSASIFEKVLCLSVECMKFVQEMYGLPKKDLEFYPLGGFVYDDDEYDDIRQSTRALLGVDNDKVIFVQSGKLDKSKKLIESLEAFGKANDPKALFFIAGHFHEDIREEALRYVERDSRIVFLGWKTADELKALLCAADVYVQPGTQSATMQMSLCCRCAVILDDVPSHVPYIDGNGWVIGSGVSLEDTFRECSEDTISLMKMSLNSTRLASRMLDYRKLAARIYS